LALRITLYFFLQLASTAVIMANPMPAHTRYRDWYQGMPDSFAGQYQQLMAVFSPENDTAPATLRDTVLNSGSEIPKVFAALTRSGPNDAPRIAILHRPTKYSPALAQPTAWDDQAFAFASDVGPGNQVSLVSWPPDPFVRSGFARVPTTERLTALWQGAGPGVVCFGPFADDAAETTNLRARRMAPIPHAYVGITLGRLFTPQEFWTEVIHQILTDGRGDQCQVLVAWARAACTWQTAPAAGTEGVCLLNAVTLNTPVADTRLQAKVWDWLTSDLPALNRAEGSINEQLVAQTAALREEFSLQRTEAATARAAQKAPKTVSEKYPEASGTLMRICETPLEENLPPFWRLYPNLQKKEVFSALTMAVTNRANADDSSNRAPAITPEIIERISSFRFGAHDVDDLTGGLSPFLMVAGTPDEQAEARERSRVYSMVHAGNAAPTLDQLTNLVTNAPRSPRRFFNSSAPTVRTARCSKSCWASNTECLACSGRS
jgi:hypothetical protein